MQYSSGYVNEFTYVLLCYGLIHAIEYVEEEDSDKRGVEPRYADYKTNKRIARRFDTLKKQLLEFIQKHGEMEKVITPKKERLFNAILAKINNKKVVLDYLVCYILFFRFQKNERTKPLHQDFDWLTKKDGSLMELIDLLNTLDVSKREEEMFNIAEQISKEL